MKLLIVEDNPRLADRMKHRLRKHYTIDAVETGSEALKLTDEVEYSVILLDLGLPDMKGDEVCRRLRAKNIHTPILVLTGNGENETKVGLLDSGADDYVTKPFDSEELRARIGALGRRRTRREPLARIEYGDLVIDTEQRKVYRANQLVSLRRKEFDILEYLVTNQGRVLTREMIMNHAWDSEKISWKSTVDVHIKHLRDKIDRPFDHPIIKTCYGLGYRVDMIE